MMIEMIEMISWDVKMPPSNTAIWSDHHTIITLKMLEVHCYALWAKRAELRSSDESINESGYWISIS